MTRELINLRHLRAFCAVARTGSVSGAASVVHLSQPAVTQALAKLERRLSVQLFVRARTGMTLTEPGALFCNRGERALGLIDSAARSVTLPQSARGRIASHDQAFVQKLTSGQLHALVAVADHGNFSMAARSIGISQPSLHRLARDLERNSGVAFYSTVTQGVALTRAARSLARYARLAFSELNQGFDEVDAWRGVDSSRIAIGTLPLVRTLILPRAINQLTQLRPYVHIRVVDGPYDDLLNHLRHGQIDVLVGALRTPPPIEDVVQERLFDDELVVVAGRNHPLTKPTKRKVTLTELAKYPWVVPRRGTPTRAHFDALWRDSDRSLGTPVVESSSLVLIRGLLLGDQRLTILSRRQIAVDAAQGLLYCVPFDLPQTPRPIGLTVRRDWQPTATQALLLDLLRITQDQPATRPRHYSETE